MEHFIPWWSEQTPGLSLPVAWPPAPPPLLGHQRWCGRLLVPGGQGPHACGVVIWPFPRHTAETYLLQDTPWFLLMLKWAEWLIHSWHLWGPWAHRIIKGRRINRNRGAVLELSKPLALPASHTSLERQRGQKGQQFLAATLSSLSIPTASSGPALLHSTQELQKQPCQAFLCVCGYHTASQICDAVQGPFAKNKIILPDLGFSHFSFPSPVSLAQLNSYTSKTQPIKTIPSENTLLFLTSESSVLFHLSGMSPSFSIWRDAKKYIINC